MARQPQQQTAPETPNDDAPERQSDFVDAGMVPSRNNIEDIAARSRTERDEAGRDQPPAIDRDDPNRPYVGLDQIPDDDDGQQASGAAAAQEPEKTGEDDQPQPGAGAAGADQQDGGDVQEVLADPEAIIETVVRGQTVRMKVKDWIPQAQKVLWADQYFEHAKTLENDIRAWQAQQQQQPPQGAPQPAPAGQQPVSDGGTPTPSSPGGTQTPGAPLTPEDLGINLDALMQALNYEDEETAKQQLGGAFAAVANTVSQRMQGGTPAPAPEQITSMVLNTLEGQRLVTNAVEAVEARYPGFHQDEDARTIATRHFQALAQQAEIEGRPFDYHVASLQSADEAARRLGMQPATPAESQGAAQQPGNPLEQRRQAKRGMDTPPAAAGRRAGATNPAQQQQQPVSEASRRYTAAQEIAAARGQELPPQQ